MSLRPMSEKTIDFGFDDIPLNEKASRVRGVFDAVAGKYDLMNDAMSMGVHRIWKDMTITKLNPQPGELLIDVAGGTGDLARRFIKRADEVRERRSGDPARAIICDINAEMLLAGIDVKKDAGMNLTRVCGNAQSLPFPKPGGRLFVLEFSTPPDKVLRKIYDTYSLHVIPKLGGLLANEEASYQYLVESIRRFPRQEAFADMIKEAGFSRVGYHEAYFASRRALAARSISILAFWAAS